MDCGAEEYRETGHPHPWVNVDYKLYRTVE